MAHNEKDQKLAKLYPNVSEKVLGLDTVKPCRKCGSTRRGKPTKKARFGNCLDCDRKRSKKWYHNNTERALELNQLWRKENRERHKEINQKWRAVNSEKYFAQNEVCKAVLRGDLPKVSTCLCEDCGVPAQQYHHENYSKPLEVVALCVQCHKKRHTN